MKYTKIVATVGPKTESYEMLKKLGEAGVDIFRLNFSHGTHETHGKVIKSIQKLNQKTGKNYGILLDTKGPEIRTGMLEKPVEIKRGEKIIFTIDETPYEKTKKFPINYKAFLNDVSIGDKILIDNGFMDVKVRQKKGNDVICEVINGGVMKSKRHLNLPGKRVSLPSITHHDWKDLEFGVKMGVDFFALSFVREKKDVLEVKNFLKKKKSNIKIISKIETKEAVENLNELFDASDAIMVARGDLGAETPFERVPLIQWEIKKKSLVYQKPVIVATQMLESMIENPIPTRAEVTDIFEAVWQRNDSVMLSGETTTGEYPLRAVEIMARISRNTENAYIHHRFPRKASVDTKESIFAQNAALSAHSMSAIAGIIVLSKDGDFARIVSSFRPRVHIFAFTDKNEYARQMQLLWGVNPFVIKFSDKYEKNIELVKKKLLSVHKHLKKKKFIVLSSEKKENEETPIMEIREF